ncbi:uncharacterized protein LOC133697006 isoform X1 [Populus nigra]|uniref:uncharacterized protein LOC133697006 isoform X1 n=1 Tax=Populus nigra TaxID=3691 RepID=UPI002B267A6E|nr:uncharacterized protein LOC133697006 isoform X1 [Populus nigra]
MATSPLQSSGMLSREQLLYLFNSFSQLTSQPDPSFGISCLGKVNVVYENDQDLMIRFYKFVANEEMACDEAELGPDEFAGKMHYQQKLQEQQLEMLKHMRKFHLDDQSAILEKLHQQMENANFEVEASVLSPEQVQETVRRRVSPLFQPR